MIYWLWLSKLSGIGLKTGRRLLEQFQTPKDIYDSSKTMLEAVKGLSKKQINTILENKSLEQAKYIFDQCHKNQIGIVSYQDAKYPELARDILDMPLILYYKGNLKENLQGQAIVGARRCSRAGRTHAINCVISLANQHIPVISGMAKGIDSYAHTACLHYGGFTVTVLGCGLDISSDVTEQFSLVVTN